MRVEPLVPDAPARKLTGPPPQSDAFAKTLDALGGTFQGAERAEDAFAAGTGNLQRAVYERALADVALSVATAAAQRTAQALQSILGMQI